MTYREIFLHADPRAVNDVVGAQEVKFRGRKVRLKTQLAFDICKGFKFYAHGERLDESEEEAFEKIVKANPRLTPKQARVLKTGLRGYLSAACEALDIVHANNSDKLVNEWLNQPAPDESDGVNRLAANIISKLITENQNKYE